MQLVSDISIISATDRCQRQKEKKKKVVEVKVFRKGCTAAYCFTDYRSQGQTIPHVIVDISHLPAAGSSRLFNLYVALSRSSGRETIRLLQEFDDEIFLEAHEPELVPLEDERLDNLDDTTKQSWQEMGSK